MWIGTMTGLTRTSRAERNPFRPTPRLTVQIGTDYFDADKTLRVISGQLATFHTRVIDYRTAPNKRLFRYGVWPGRLDAPPVRNDQGWRPASLSDRFDWKPAARANTPASSRALTGT